VPDGALVFLSQVEARVEVEDRGAPLEHQGVEALGERDVFVSRVEAQGVEDHGARLER
jgi:hypothetical protein